jgi:iron complex transport system substrate-binding protein
VVRGVVRGWAAALACCACLGARAQPITVADERGKTLQLAAPATRIISIAPHLTEIAFAAGAGAKLIAVSAYSDYPPAAKLLPRVGDGARIDIERILRFKPDLVLAWKSGNQAGDIARLERLGIPVWVSEASRLADIARLLREAGRLAGTADAGERAAGAFELELRGLRDARGREHAPRVFYEIWHQPLLTVNGAHMISDAVALCGGTNVFAHLPVLTPSVTLEAVLAARPHIVLGGGSAGGEAEFLSRWRSVRLAGLRAAAARYVAPDAIQRPSPRIVEGVRAICAALHAAREDPEKAMR